MDRIEDLVRTSLRERGDDAQATPHLYRQVQRRIDRRRRQRAWTLAPIGVAVIAAVAVPLVLSNGPQVPTIADLADRPGAASATGAGELVIVDATGTTGRVDLPSGERVASLAEAGDAGMSRVLVAPERRDDPPIPVMVEVGDLPAGAGSAEPQPGQAPDSSPPPPDVPASVPGELRATAHVDGQRLLLPTDPAPGFRVAADGGATLAPDGGWLATLVTGDGGGDADGWAVQLTQVPTSTDVDVLESLELTLVLPAGSRLESWTDLEDGVGSRLAVRDPDGRILHLPMVTGDDGVPVWDDEQVEVAVDDPVDAYADDHVGGHVTLTDGVLTHVRPVDEERPAAGAVTLQDGELVTGVSTVGGEVRTEADVRDLTAGAADVALRAFGTTTVLTTDAGTWWLERGEEGWTTPVRVEHGAVDATPVGRDLAEVEDSGAAEDEPTRPDVTPPDATPPGVDAPELPADGLIVADESTVTLVAADGTRRELWTFPAEGESTVVDVAVRPGSTAADVTVAITTRAEGMFDVRWLRAVDDEWEVVPQLIEAGPFPLGADDLGVPPTVAWSPDGDLLAVVTQLSADGPVELRTLGWDDDGPSTDPNLGATFTLDTDRPWAATGWVWPDDADGVARSGQLVLIDPVGEVSALLPIERQADGAVALPPGAAPQERGDDLALDVGGARGPGGMDAELVRMDDTLLLRLWRWEDEVDGTGSAPIFVDVSEQGSADGMPVVTGWPEAVLLVLDPDRPVVVDRTGGRTTPVDLGGRIVAADVVR